MAIKLDEENKLLFAYDIKDNCHLQEQKLQGKNKCYRRIEDWFKTMQQSSTSSQNFPINHLNLS